jgi:hypothetical protein
MTAVIVIIALAAYLSGGDDHVDGIEPQEPATGGDEPQ